YAGAIRAAFGLSDQPVASPYLVAMSILHLLGECAEAAPLLLLVDDAHWLDDSTTGALAFVARRLESDPILMVVALRDGFESPFLKARVAELDVMGLPDEDAAALLHARAPGLAPVHRDRILREAAGNPLALVELSSVIDPGPEPDPARAATLPL